MEKCPICGVEKDDVMERPDHYTQDVGNQNGATMISCASCEEANADDI